MQPGSHSLPSTTSATGMMSRPRPPNSSVDTCVSQLHHHRTPPQHWQPQSNLVLALRDTFLLERYVDGAVWPTHFHHTMHPHRTGMHEWHTYMSATAPARFLCCIQQNAPPLEPLLSRARHKIPTTAIILCPESHPYHERLSTHEDTLIHVLAHTRKLTTHDTDVTRDQSPYRQSVTLFWIHVQAAPLLQHTVLSTLRPMVRKAKGQVHPVPEQWALHE